jgi:PPOX class probable F420-dependent enzyme
MELSDALVHAAGSKQGVLVTLRRDGVPQLSNVFFHLEAGVAKISVTDTRAKTANARRDNRVSLWVSHGDFFHYVVLEGTAELSPVAQAPDDPTVDELVELYRAMNGEHSDWDEYRDAMVEDRRLVLRLTAHRAYGMWP